MLPPLPGTSVLGPGGGSLTLDLRPALDALTKQLALPAANLLDIGTLFAQASGYCSGSSPRLLGGSQVSGLKVLGANLPVGQVINQILTLTNAGSIDPSNLDVTKLDLSAVGLPSSVLGNAGGGSDAVGPAATALALQCTARDLVLIDVLPRGNKVSLLGAADRRFIGQRVAIVFSATGRTVAHATVGQDGIFRATAPLPPSSLRGTNRARYQAKIGSERSLRLKLMRRMAVTRVNSAGGKVTIQGRVLPPLGAPTRSITLKRRVSCTRSVTVERIRPDRHGRFQVTVNGPSNAQAAVYRLETQVRKNRRNPKLFPTFTLPRFVEL